MRRNVFITEFILPIVVCVAMLLPIFAVERLLLGWPKGALSITEIVGGALFMFAWQTIGSWLAPRIGLPPPAEFAKRRGNLHR